MMLFGNEVIDLINVKKANLSPSQLLNLKQALILRNEENLNVATDEPQFALHTYPAKGKAASPYVLI